MPARLGGALLAGLALLGGCASAPPVVPPTELGPIEREVTFARRWSASVDGAGRGRFDPWVDARRVVVADGDGRVTAFERDGGRRLWRTDLDERLASGVGGEASAPSAARLYVGSDDGVVHALDAESGEPLWSATVSSEVRVAPIEAFGAVLVRSVDGRIVALEPEDGDERWSVSNAPPALTVAGYGRPLLVDGGALVGLDDGRVLALALDSGRVIWESVLSLPSGRSEVERLVDVDADPVAGDAGIYVVNYQGRTARLEPGRGEPVWSRPMSSTAGLALAGERVVVVDEEDVLHALDRESGRTLWTNEALRGRRLSPPAATADGRALLVGDFEGYVHVLDADDGRLVGRARPASGPISARPYVDGTRVFTLGEDGEISSDDLAR